MADADELIAVATAKKKAAESDTAPAGKKRAKAGAQKSAKKQAARKQQAKAAAAEVGGELPAQPKPKRKSRRKSIDLVQAEPEATDAHEIDEWEQQESWTLNNVSWPGVAAFIACLAVVALSIYAWRSAPAPDRRAVVVMPEEVPKPLLREWLINFPSHRRLFTEPDGAVLDAFAAYLNQQVAIDTVHGVRIEHRETGANPPLKVVVDVALETPVLPVMLANGERAWLGDGGMILPGILPGPAGLPLVRGIEVGGVEAVAELLAVWPDLHTRLERVQPGLITEIRCDYPLFASTKPGLMFRTRPGTLLNWGAPGETNFGVDRETRIRNLVHTIRCQGDLRLVPEINARFHEPFAVLHAE